MFNAIIIYFRRTLLKKFAGADRTEDQLLKTPSFRWTLRKFPGEIPQSIIIFFLRVIYIFLTKAKKRFELMNRAAFDEEPKGAECYLPSGVERANFRALVISGAAAIKACRSKA